MSIAYRIGLLLVAILMVVLPVLYCALLVAVGWLVYEHAVTHLSWLSHRWSATLYVGLLFSGGVLIVFMLKPFFAPRGNQPPTRKISTAEAPTFFKLISIISEKIGAPLPAEVELDCDVNASASFSGGFSGFRRDELTLTIGLPLVAAMTQRQLAGVIAHELGHFRQGGARRLTFITRCINGWFARVVYERDEWDQRLDDAFDNAGGSAGLIVAMAKLCVWLTRSILWVFMMLAHGISCFMLRQMEYDADRCEVSIAGSGAFEAGANCIRELGMTDHFVWKRIGESYGREPLPENLPALMSKMRGTMPPELTEKVHKHAGSARTGLFDTHPSDAARLRAAKANPSPGLPFAERPASKLLPDFERLSCEVTALKYSMLPPMSAAQTEVDAARYL